MKKHREPRSITAWAIACDGKLLSSYLRSTKKEVVEEFNDSVGEDIKALPLYRAVKVHVMPVWKCPA